MLSGSWERVAQAAVLVWSLAASGAAAQEMAFEGFTEPYRTIDLGPAEPGTIASLAVREGDAVQQGQLLATLDCDVLQVSLKIAQANNAARGRLASALAERDLRQMRLKRLDELRVQGHASQEEVDRARTDLAIAEASVLSAQEQQVVDALECERIEAMIERRTLRSPIHGVVARVHREEKEFVTANAPTVLTVVQLDPLQATFNITTPAAAAIAVGQTVSVTLSESDLRVYGRVEFIAPVTEAESGTVRVRVLLDNPRGEYRCGVRCSLELPPVRPVVAAPRP